MIDEYLDQWVDRACLYVPKVVRPRVVLMSNSSLGWRILLYFGTLSQKIREAFGHIKNEESMELLMRETAEFGDDSMDRIKRFFQDQVLALTRLEARGRSIRFCGTLFLLMLSVLGVVAVGGQAMGVTAASLCVLWLSTAMECNYRPVSGGVHQRYLAATMLRSAAISLMMISYFFSYLVQGVPSNVILQCAMIITLVIHDILFLGLIAFNRRQPIFLRALAGVTGAMPALTAAAAIALCASCLFRPWPLPFSGVASALGAVLAFTGDQLINITHLGGIRLKYHSIWVCLFMLGGFTLMLLGAWTYMP